MSQYEIGRILSLLGIVLIGVGLYCQSNRNRSNFYGFYTVNGNPNQVAYIDEETLKSRNIIVGRKAEKP